jgi:hypothetical protein
LLLLILGLVLVAVAGLWYGLDGYEFVEMLFPHPLERAEASEPLPIGVNDLPTLHLDISPQGYRALELQREDALEKGILGAGHGDESRWVGAQVRLRDETTPIYVRLAEDWADPPRPLLDRKWPFEVKTEDGALILGTRSFSLRSPASSGYLYQWLYIEDLRRAGILAPHYAFVNVWVNGDPWGVYALCEGLSSELLASQGRDAGWFLHLDGSLFWQRRAAFSEVRDQDWDPDLDPIASTLELAAFARAEEYGPALPQDDPAWSNARTEALDRLRAFTGHRLPASQVFDAEKMGRYIAHTNLWGARDGLKWYNEWYYSDPSASRLEPVGGRAFTRALVRDTPMADLAQYDDLEIMEAYAREVAQIARPEYLDELRAANEDAYNRYYLALGQEFASMDMETPWGMLLRRREWLLRSLHPPQTVHARQVGGELDGMLNVQVSNLLRYPVVLDKVHVGDRTLDVRVEWIPQGDRASLHEEALPSAVLRRVEGDVPRAISVHIPTSVLDELVPGRTGIYTGPLQLVTHLVGVEERSVVDVARDDSLALSDAHLPARPSVEDALAKHPFLRLGGRSGYLELRPGSWHVDGDLILPDGYGLQATRSVTLTFDRDAILFASGPLLLHGPDGSGIHFLPTDEDWGGLIVLHTDPRATSSLHNVEIRGASGVRRSGWRAIGGVTFYESSLVLSHCQIRGSTARAAVHVIHADFELVRTAFERVAGDAFKADFARGRIEQCAFYDVRGNGVDVSGSQVSVQDASLVRVYGQGISASENAVIDAEGVRASEVYVAMASVDMSSLRAQDVHISRAWAAGFAAYREKGAYGVARIQASGVTFQDDSIRALVGEENSAVIDGETILPGELLVEELRRRQDALVMMHDLDYRFASQIDLIGYHLATPEPGPGDPLVLTLYWHALVELDREYTVFVHVRDASGQTVLGWDNVPCQDACPTTGWRVGRLVEDTHLIPLPADMPAGDYRVAIGLYHLPTGERLSIRAPVGEDLPDATLVLERTVRVG